MTLNTGQTAKITLGQQDQKTINHCRQGIMQGLAARRAVPFADGPLAHLRVDYKSVAKRLILTTYGPSGPYEPGKIYKGDRLIPLTIVGISAKDREQRLMDLLVKTYQDAFGDAPKRVNVPATPWMASVILPSAHLHIDAIAVLDDFAQHCAHAWINSLIDRKGGGS